MLSTLGFFFELLTAFSSFILSYFLLRNGKKYVANRMLSVAMVNVGLYAFFVFLYDLIGNALIVQIFYRLALICLIFAVLFLYVTMQVMVHSEMWLKERKKWVPFLIGAISLSIVLIFWDFIEIISLNPTDTQINFLALLIISIWVFSILVLSLVDLYLHGIRKLPKSRIKNRMKLFGLGLGTNLIAVVVTGLSNVTPSEELGKLLDMLFFAILAIGMTVMALSIIKFREEDT